FPGGLESVVVGIGRELCTQELGETLRFLVLTDV
ncbi:hypothetical protein ZOSMA_10867G00010, partial [Zostera marina]